MTVIEVYDLLRDKEYHKDEDLIFFNNREFEELCSITKGYDFTESELKLYFKGEYFCVYLEDLLDHTWLEYEEREMIIKQIRGLTNGTH